jgi:hypothetical protein
VTAGPLLSAGHAPRIGREAFVIVMVTRFSLSADTDWEALRQIAAERMALYTGVPGLRSKAIIVDPDHCAYGGHYVWEDRSSIDDFLASPLYRGAVERFGEPEIVTNEVAAFIDHGDVVDVLRAGR